MIKAKDLEFLSKEQLLELSEAIDENLESFDASEEKRREFEEAIKALKVMAKKTKCQGFRIKSLEAQLADLESNRAFGDDEQYQEEFNEIYEILQGKLSTVSQLWNKICDFVCGRRRSFKFVWGFRVFRVARYQ